MALVVLPEGQQRSGAQGGIVWSRNRGGAYIRGRGMPTNPNTDRQATVRQAVSTLTSRWSDVLTDADRFRWNLYAESITVLNRLGQERKLSGINHYVRSNVPRLQHALPGVDQGPVVYNIGEPEADLGVTADLIDQELDITFDDSADWCTEDGAAMFVQVGRPLNPGTSYFRGPWRSAGIIAGIALGGVASPQSLESPWPLAADQGLVVRARIGRADGRLSGHTQATFQTS